MIKQIFCDKKQYLDLLLLADEQEDMIDRYLDRGEMFGLWANEVLCSVCVITSEGSGVLEIKNIATYPQFQKMGYAKKLIVFLENRYSESFSTIIVGTGDSPLTIPFYKKCGFSYSHKVKNFFVDNYNHEIYEEGIRLVDMVYLKKNL